MKIYTKTGDDGSTGLFGGSRVSKTHIRTRAYGEIDELNAVLGLVLAHASTKTDTSKKISEILLPIQAHLFVVGSHIATPYELNAIPSTLPPCTDGPIMQLEQWIDEMQNDLPELTNFILPGGSPTGATLHVARTVCRRAERSVVEAMETEELLPVIVQYLNRLSDFLFVLARYVNQAAEMPETDWKSQS